MKNLLVNLPEDVIINNILLSKVLPIKSLLNLRCVCKYLRNLITSPDFIKMQISTQLNNNNHPLVLIKSTSSPDVLFSLKFNGADTCRPEVVEFVSPIDYPNIWGSCNGLLCLANSKGENVCLWNPSTKEYKVLPPPLPLTKILISLKFAVSPITYEFGYDHLIDDYKIIRCVERIHMTEFQVYTLGTNTWRKINNNPYKFYFVLWQIMVDTSTVFVNGALHWIMSTSDWSRVSILERTNAKIVSFDIEKEEFREIYTPSLAKFKPQWRLSPRIQVLRGCLSVLEFGSSNKTLFNVWMMMDYGVEGSWTKLFTILVAEVPEYTRTLSSYTLLSFCENDTEILIGSNNGVLVYSLINNKARHVEFAEKDMYEKSLIYIESLVSLNSGVYNIPGQKENSIKEKERDQSSLSKGEFDQKENSIKEKERDQSSLYPRYTNSTN